MEENKQDVTWLIHGLERFVVVLEEMLKEHSRVSFPFKRDLRKLAKRVVKISEELRGM